MDCHLNADGTWRKSANILVERYRRARRTIPSSFQLPVEMLLQFVNLIIP